MRINFIERLELVENADSVLIDEAAHLLAKEFYPEGRYEEGFSYHLEKLASDQTISRISLLNGEIVGVATANIFPWPRIQRQLYYQPFFQDGFVSSIRLRGFEDAIKDIIPIQSPSVAAEMAYNLVLPKYRGNGLGRYQWNMRLNRILNLYENPVVFTFARSAFSGTGISALTIKYMIQQERILQEIEEEEELIVEGIYVPLVGMGEELGVDLSHINMYSGSNPTIHVAESEGFIPIGFSRNFCPVWVRQYLNRPMES
jgi:hypothetical protein